MWVTSPRAMVLNTPYAYAMPGRLLSEEYLARPVSFCGPSMRGLAAPMIFSLMVAVL